VWRLFVHQSLKSPRLLVRLNHIATFIVNPDHSMM
jgi:hypothetical protein